MRAEGTKRTKGVASDDPICISSGSESSPDDQDLRSALAHYARSNMPRDSDGLLARAAACPSRTGSGGVGGSKGKRRVDAPQPGPPSKRARKTLRHENGSSQTTLTQFPDIRVLQNDPRPPTQPSQRTPTKPAVKPTASKSHAGIRAPPKQSKLFSGTDKDHAIVISDDELRAKAPPKAARPPPPRTFQTVLTPQKIVRERRILVPETVEDDGVLVDATISPNKHTLVPETALTPAKPSISPAASRKSVRDDNPFKVGNSVSPSKVRKTSSFGGRSFRQPSAGTSNGRSRDSTPSRRRQRSMTGTTAEERQERREIQRQANERMLSVSPAPQAQRPPPPPSILDQLALTPTPKKPRLSDVVEEDPPSPLRSIKNAGGVDPRERRLQFAPTFEDESYRPNPRTKSARRPGTETMRVAQARPRRYVSEPGKYTLPDPNTPIHQWPTTAGTTHTKRSVKKEQVKAKTPRAEGKENGHGVDDEPVDKHDETRQAPKTSQCGRSRSLSSELTPPPETQAPRAALATPSSVFHAPPSQRSLPRAPHTPTHTRVSQPTSIPRATPTSGSRLSKTASMPRPSHPASLPRPSQTTSLPSLPRPSQAQSPSKTPKTATTPSASRTRAAEPCDAPGDAEGSPTDHEDDFLGLDLYADFAQYAASPASSMHSRGARPSGRLSLSPLASKVTLTPARPAQSAGPSPRAAPLSAQKPVSQESPLKRRLSQTSQASQSSAGSVTARVLALEQDQVREAEDERGRARKAAEERELRIREQLMLLEGTEDEDEDGMVSLSQILGKYEAEKPPNGTPGRRRSTRTRQSASTADMTSPPPRAPPRKTAEERRQDKFFSAMDRDVKRGTTTAQVDAALRRRSEEDKAADVDFANTSGVGADVLAAVKHIQDVRDYNERVEVGEEYAAFWDRSAAVPRATAEFALPIDISSDHPAVLLLQGIDDDGDLAEALSCLPPLDAGPEFNEWLFVLSLCARGDVGSLALHCLLQSIPCAADHPFGDSGHLIDLVNAVLNQLGGKGLTSEITLPTITTSREAACVALCRVITATARSEQWVSPEDACSLVGTLILVSADSCTSETLARELARTLSALLNVLVDEGKASAFHSIVIDAVRPLPLHTQVRALLALRSGGAAARGAVTWLATDLLLPGSYEVSLCPSTTHVLAALGPVRDELRAGTPDFLRVSGLLALWGMAITDVDWGVPPTGDDADTSSGNKGRDRYNVVAHTLIGLRNFIVDDADDVLAAEVKGRLQLFVEVARLHSDTARERARYRRVSRHGLELGDGDQTRLSLGRKSSLGCK